MVRERSSSAVCRLAQCEVAMPSGGASRTTVFAPPRPGGRLVHLDEQRWPGVLRRRTWDADAEAWRWNVDVWIDGHRVTQQLGQDEIEEVLVHPAAGAAEQGASNAA